MDVIARLDFLRSKILTESTTMHIILYLWYYDGWDCEKCPNDGPWLTFSDEFLQSTDSIFLIIWISFSNQEIANKKKKMFFQPEWRNRSWLFLLFLERLVCLKEGGPWSCAERVGIVYSIDSLVVLSFLFGASHNVRIHSFLFSLFLSYLQYIWQCSRTISSREST